MKKVCSLLAVIGVFFSASTHAASFKDITNWVGIGTNQAGFEVDWNDGTTNRALIWGYRWNGDVNGEQMLDAIVAADPHLYAEVSGGTQFGTALFGFGWDQNGDQVFPLTPSLTFNASHLAFTDYNGVVDARTNVDSGDRWQEGWFSAGFWSYWLSDDGRLADDSTDWSFSPLGMSSRVLVNGDWDGWSFSREFNDSLPFDPAPPSTNVVTLPPHPAIRLVHAFNYDDGTAPSSGLTWDGSTLYGMTSGGGTNGYGVVFAVHTDGLNFTNVHYFAGDSEGRFPLGGLVLSDGMLYGTTSDQGTGSSGTIFSIGTNGANFTTLRPFVMLSDSTNVDGAFPQCGLVLDGSALYGSSYSGGIFGSGTLFGINLNGTSFADLHDFTPLDENGFNQGGVNPSIDLVASGGILYGVATYGGANGAGNIFKVNANGSGFVILHSFTQLNDSTNDDGTMPYGKLLLTNGVLYGTTYSGGNFGNGTVFSIRTDGSGFSNLHNFGAFGENSANDDGASPIGGLALDRSTLYGVTQYGGKKGQGAIYQINTDGSGFFSLASFPRLGTGSSTNAVGANPGAGLVWSGNSLYGTTSAGGPNGDGTVFALDLPNPPLAMAMTNRQLAISWPIWAPNYTLETSTNFSSGVWNVVTNDVAATNFIFNAPMNGQANFFRLRK